MKRLIVLITIVVIICFVAVFANAQNNTDIATQIQQSKNKCSLFLGQVLDGSDRNLEHFENKVEYLLETTFFWENCLVNELRNGQDIFINFIGYVKAEPTKTELKYLIKSAVVFKEELEDYIEEQMPRASLFHDGDRYIFLNPSDNLGLPKSMQKIIKKENRKFDITSPNGRIFINIAIMKSSQNSDGISIKINN
ncbi:MAG: hypothetical protein K6E94_02375 [Elusimicrobiaceae bacterium]|nr:hypothetical protein [Elusimicrobiaceae bacterium]